MIVQWNSLSRVIDFLPPRDVVNFASTCRSSYLLVRKKERYFNVMCQKHHPLAKVSSRAWLYRSWFDMYRYICNDLHCYQRYQHPRCESCFRRCSSLRTYAFLKHCTKEGREIYREERMLCRCCYLDEFVIGVEKERYFQTDFFHIGGDVYASCNLREMSMSVVNMLLTKESRHKLQTDVRCLQQRMRDDMVKYNVPEERLLTNELYRNVLQTTPIHREAVRAVLAPKFLRFYEIFHVWLVSFQITPVKRHWWLVKK